MKKFCLGVNYHLKMSALKASEKSVFIYIN